MRDVIRTLLWMAMCLPFVSQAVEGTGAVPAPREDASVPIPLTLDPTELDIKSLTDGSTTTYKTGLTLSSPTNVTIQPGATALREKGGTREIPVTSIHFDSASPFALTTGYPRLLAVSVETPFSRGTFCGLVKFSGTVKLQPAQLSLCITLNPKPNIVTLPTPLNFKVTRCNPSTCWLAALLSRAMPPDHALQWKLNDAAASDQALAAVPQVLAVHGDKSGAIVDLAVERSQADGSTASLALGETLPFGFEGLRLAFKSARDLRPDHYQGQLPLGAVNGPVTLAPVGIDVRDGPALALLVLLAGIVVGRLIQASNSASNQSQVRLLDRYNSVLSAVSRIQDPSNKRFLELNLENSLMDIRHMVRSEQDILGDLNTLDRLAADSQKLDEWTPTIQAETNANLKQQLIAALAAARTAIDTKNLETADAQIALVISLLGTSQGPQQQAAAAAASRSGIAAGFAAAGPAGVPGGHSGGRVIATALSILSGAHPFGEAWYYYVRPLLYLLVLAALAFLGLYNFYIHNATFGAEGFFDYLALFLWGLSADVAQKSLQQLSFAVVRP